MIAPDLNLVLSSFEEVSPFLERAYDRQHLLVVDLVVPLDWV